MNRITFEELKTIVDYGDAYFIDDDGEIRNICAFYVDADEQVWLAEDPANLERRR